MNASHVIRSTGLLLARLGIGIVFLAHGLQKLNAWGFEGTKAGFASMGAPAPAVTGFLATWAEILGGAALIAGLLVPVAGLVLLADMLGAFFLVHIHNGIWIGDGGYELVLALGAGALAIAAAGAGAFGLDALLARRLPAGAGRLLAPARAA